MIIFAGCKINLGLNILGKREDGYHNLETLLYPVPWNDIIEIVPSNQFSFSFSGLIIDGQESDNLVVKAYNLLKSEYDLSPVKIHLHKQIPFGAGLGGGSSDAVSTLILLNKIFNINLSSTQLKNFASKLGADCPFFVENIPVLAKGIGTDLESFEIDLSGYYLLIIKPDIHISTAMAYGSIKSFSNSGQVEKVLINNPESWRDILKNDFEFSIAEKYPQIADIKNIMYQNGAIYSSMTGSGSAIFGLFKTPPNFSIPNIDFQRVFKL